MQIEQVLAERQKTHGLFRTHAFISQSLLEVLISQENWHKLDDAQREALQMICHKMARIMAGDPNHKDHWTDISGYAKLIEQML